jgi:hypothetical protein
MLDFDISPFDISKKNLSEAIVYSNHNDYWKNTPHEGMNLLTIDQSGKVGERTFHDWCRSCADIRIDYDDKNTNQPDGVYEGSISLASDPQINVNVTNPKYLILTERVVRNKFRYENKTARIGKHGQFQHENVKPKEFCDLIVFLDYTPHEIYLTIMSSDFDLSEKHPVFGVKPHIRKDSISGYKFDLGATAIAKGIEAGITIRVDDRTPKEHVHNFIKKFLI